MNNQLTFYWKPVNSEKDLPECESIYEWDMYQYGIDGCQTVKETHRLNREKALNFINRDNLHYLSEALPEPAQRENEKWISTEHAPLFIQTKVGWECTEAGDKEFIAAVPYNDSRQPGKELWWIHHCVVEDGIGLCIVGDDENTPAGWELSAITHWMPLPPPPGTPTQPGKGEVERLPSTYECTKFAEAMPNGLLIWDEVIELIKFCQTPVATN